MLIMGGNKVFERHSRLEHSENYAKIHITDMYKFTTLPIRQDWSFCLSNVYVWILIRMTKRKICSKTPISSCSSTRLFYGWLAIFIMTLFFDDRFVLKILCYTSTSFLFIWISILFSFLSPSLSRKLYACILFTVYEMLLVF